MKIVPARIEEQITRIDPTRSRVIGISSAVLAAWCGGAFLVTYAILNRRA